MSTRREPSTPPRIPGYEHSRLLGMGGFADVFLYEQQMPRRSVAVKVLLASSFGDEVRARFRREADLMARLSHHPSIVTILHADVASDGRPFLVMEYCSRAGLGQRYREERMGVAEVLRIGVRLASAVETAHRAGILHRDIKPANVLVTDFGWPALTDFGIAAATGPAAGSAIGMSIPWCPPELLAEHPVGDARADIYSLAATVYSLLARRSPFEVADASNTAADLIARIERAALPPIGRPDVSASLQAVLERAMDRAPARRYHSALALARALQHVEAELMLPITPLDLPQDVTEEITRDGDGAAGTDGGEAGQATRLRPVQSVSPEAGPAGRTAGAGGRRATDVGVLVGDTDGAGVPEAWRRHAADVGALVEDGARPGRRGRSVLGVLAGVAVIGAVGVAGVLSFQQDPAAPPSCVRDARAAGDAACDPTPTSTFAAIRAVPSPTALAGVVAQDGSAVFTWANPDREEGDAYLWGVATPGAEPALEVVTIPTVTVQPPVPGQDVCIEVSIVRVDGRYSTEPATGCAGS